MTKNLKLGKELNLDSLIGNPIIGYKKENKGLVPILLSTFLETELKIPLNSILNNKTRLMLRDEFILNENHFYKNFSQHDHSEPPNSLQEQLQDYRMEKNQEEWLQYCCSFNTERYIQKLNN